jgi:hypothetical protein
MPESVYTLIAQKHRVSSSIDLLVTHRSSRGRIDLREAAKMAFQYAMVTA